MRTADSGYLTRRLVDVAQEVIVRETDCFEERGEKVRGIKIEAIGEMKSLEDRAQGRVAAEDIIDPKTGEVICALNETIDYKKAALIGKAGIKSVTVRSVLTCRCRTAYAPAATA